MTIHIFLLWPQLLLLTLQALSFIYVASNHGRPITGRYNVASSLGITAVNNLLLWWGGFFG